MHGWLIEKNYNHLFKILLDLKNESKMFYYRRELTREFYALSIQKRIYTYVTMQKKKKKTEGGLSSYAHK
jgi:hypothetical protein